MHSAGIITFHSNSAAMRAEAVLRRALLDVRLITTPRELSSDCGVALRFNTADTASVRALLDKAGVPIAAFHELPTGDP